jgi:hypothetical protein
MTKPTTCVEMVPFHGDMLQAVRDEGGVWVALRPMCEALGVSVQSQLAKLRSKGWACVRLIVTHDASGRAQEMVTVSLDTVPMWLATIEASRVGETVRAKLGRYQCDAARVLAAHFLPRATPALPVDGVVAHGVRMGDCSENRDEIRRYCQLAAKADGWTIGKIHGLVRRRHRISSVYYLGLVFWPAMRDELHEIALGKRPNPRPPTRLLNPPSARQRDLFGPS